LRPTRAPIKLLRRIAMSRWTSWTFLSDFPGERVRPSIMRILNTRIIAIAVTMLLWPAVALASKDCMTKTEARKVYRTSYLYWHGKGRCWDASPRASHRPSKVGAAQRRGVKASHNAQTKPKPTVDEVDASQGSTPAERTLTPDDLRTWANSRAEMTTEPSVTILGRWPDEEFPQHRTKLTAVKDPSLMNSRTVIMVIIIIMVLLAVLIEVRFHRRTL
jgi:hypothetical protein